MATVTKPPTFNHEESQRRVRHPLQLLRKYIRTYVILEGVALTILCAAILFWAGLAFDFGLFNINFDAIGVYGLDWIFELNDVDSTGMSSLVCRIALLAVIVVSLLVLGFSKVALRWFREFNDQALALVLERRFPKELGDRLITAIELHDPKLSKKYGFSQEMVEKTIEEAVERLKVLPIGSVFNWRRLYGLWFLVGLTTIGIWVITLALISGGTAMFAERWLDPYRYAWKFYHVSAVWTERNVLMKNTYWPRGAHLEIERFQTSKKFDDIMRVEKDETQDRPRPDLQVRAYQWVIADRAAKSGWRPLKWEDLGEHGLVNADVLERVDVPVRFGDWLVSPEELEPNLTDALFGSETKERRSGELRDLFATDEIKEKIDKRGAGPMLTEWLDWKQWTVDKVQVQFKDTNVRTPLRALHNGDVVDALAEVFARLQDLADSPSMERTLRKLDVPEKVDVVFHGAKEREKAKNENETPEEEKARLAREADERPVLVKDGNRSPTPLTTKIKGNRFTLPLKGLKDSPHFLFRARGEDFYTPIKIVTLVPAPAPVKISIDKDEPAYIYHRLRGIDQTALAGQKHLTRDLPLPATGDSNTIDPHLGANLVIHVEIDRNLRSDRSVVVGASPNAPKNYLGYPGTDPVLTGRRGFTLSMTNITRDHDFTVEFIDEDNIRGQRRFKVLATPDTEPQIGPLSLGAILRKPRFQQPTPGDKGKAPRDYSELTNSYLITAIARVPFECSLKDDYGLVKVGYHYRYRPVDFELVASGGAKNLPKVEIDQGPSQMRNQLVTATTHLWPHHPFPWHQGPQRLTIPTYVGVTTDVFANPAKKAAVFREGYVPSAGFQSEIERRDHEMIDLRELKAKLIGHTNPRGWEFEFKNDLDGFDVGKTLPQLRAFDPKKMTQLHYQLQVAVQATDNNVENGAVDKITGIKGNTKKNPNGYISFLIVTENELLAQIAIDEELFQEKVEHAKEKIDASMTSLLEQQSKTRDPKIDMEIVLGRMNEIKTAISTAGNNLSEVQNAYKNIIREMEINQVHPDRRSTIQNNIINRLNHILDDAEKSSYPLAEKNFQYAYELVEREASAQRPPDSAAHEKNMNLAYRRLQVLSEDLNGLLVAMTQGMVEAKLIAMVAAMEQKKRRDTDMLNRLWLEEVERQLRELTGDDKKKDDKTPPKKEEKKTSLLDRSLELPAMWSTRSASAVGSRSEPVMSARRQDDRHELPSVRRCV